MWSNRRHRQKKGRSDKERENFACTEVSASRELKQLDSLRPQRLFRSAAFHPPTSHRGEEELQFTPGTNEKIWQAKRAYIKIQLVLWHGRTARFRLEKNSIVKDFPILLCNVLILWTLNCIFCLKFLNAQCFMSF